MNTRIYAAVAGVFFGLMSAKLLFVGSGLSLVVWGLVGVALGWFLALGSRDAIILGSIYGLSISISFLFGTFGGTTEQLPGYLILTLGLSIVGVLGGIFTVVAGTWIKDKFRS